MSGSVRNFFNRVRDEVTEAFDDVTKEARDVINDAERKVDDLTSDDTDTPSTTSREAQVTRLYDTVFDYPPDDEGLVFWTNALRVGFSLDDVAGLFVASPDFQDRYGDLDTGEFVDLLYWNALDRGADPEGLAFWTESLETGRLDRGDVVAAISESPEHVARIGPVAHDAALI